MSDPIGPILIVGVLFVGVILLIALVKAANEKARKTRIYQKYGHGEVAEDIIKKRIWTGQSSDQLVDSIGSPHDIDQKVLKTKKKEIWKYAHKGGNRYGMRITVENNVVVGWDEKL
jgi:hypothetical protein